MIIVNSFADLEECMKKNKIKLKSNEIIKVKDEFVIYKKVKGNHPCHKCYFGLDCFPFGDCCDRDNYAFEQITEIEMLIMKGNEP